jgi:hypothetical protein
MYNINSFNTLMTLTRIEVELEGLIVAMQKAIVKLSDDNNSGRFPHEGKAADPYFPQLNNNLVGANDELEQAMQRILRAKQLLLRNSIYAGHDTPATAGA